jgi:DNA repair photolyase
MRVKEIEAKSILTKSKLPGVDYVVNPYVGCQFGCSYCYATFMGRLVNEPLETWGEYLYVRTNTCELFAKELGRFYRRKHFPSIFLSSVTDAYQGPEKKYRLTRGVLEILVERQYPGSVGILTKSPLVTRDIDLFKQLADVDVGVTVTAADDNICRFVEAQAPFERHRFAALRKLNEEGVSTYAFVGPLLPHLSLKPEALEAIFRDLAAVGVRSVYVEHVNMKPYILQRLGPVIANEPREIARVYQQARSTAYREKLDVLVETFLAKYALELIGGETIRHDLTR